MQSRCLLTSESLPELIPAVKDPQSVKDLLIPVSENSPGFF